MQKSRYARKHAGLACPIEEMIERDEKQILSGAQRRQSRYQLMVQVAGKAAAQGAAAEVSAQGWKEAITGQQHQQKKKERKKKKRRKMKNRTGRRMAPAAPLQEEPRLRLRRSKDTEVDWEHWIKTGGG